MTTVLYKGHHVQSLLSFHLHISSQALRHSMGACSSAETPQNKTGDGVIQCLAKGLWGHGSDKCSQRCTQRSTGEQGSRT